MTYNSDMNPRDLRIQLRMVPMTVRNADTLMRALRIAEADTVRRWQAAIKLSRLAYRSGDTERARSRLLKARRWSTEIRSIRATRAAIIAAN